MLTSANIVGTLLCALFVSRCVFFLCYFAGVGAGGMMWRGASVACGLSGAKGEDPEDQWTRTIGQLLARDGLPTTRPLRERTCWRAEWADRLVLWWRSFVLLLFSASRRRAWSFSMPLVLACGGIDVKGGSGLECGRLFRRCRPSVAANPTEYALVFGGGVTLEVEWLAGCWWFP